MRVIAALFASDVRNLFRNVIAAVVTVGLVLVPPLYAWFTTLGFWDPYSNTGNIKVAVASVDEGRCALTQVTR
jgi:putative membrane protein